MRGFSLVEMLVVLAILGVLLAVGAVGLLGYLETTRLNQARQEVATALRLVGNKALSESQPYTVRVHSGTPARISWARAGSTGELGSVTVPHNVRVSVNPSGPIQYVGRGFPVQQHVLTLERGSRSATVVVLTTGKVVTP
jgi:prepilin-type N-terminal cleavage/methylation domain-containing protein